MSILTQNALDCSGCGAPLTGGRDTHGTLFAPLCLACRFAEEDEERRMKAESAERAAAFLLGPLGPPAVVGIAVDQAEGGSDSDDPFQQVAAVALRAMTGGPRV